MLTVVLGVILVRLYITTLMSSHCPKKNLFFLDEVGHLHFLLDEMGLDKMALNRFNQVFSALSMRTSWKIGYLEAESAFPFLVCQPLFNSVVYSSMLSGGICSLLQNT